MSELEEFYECEVKRPFQSQTKGDYVWRWITKRVVVFGARNAMVKFAYMVKTSRMGQRLTQSIEAGMTQKIAGQVFTSAKRTRLMQSIENR